MRIFYSNNKLLVSFQRAVVVTLTCCGQPWRHLLWFSGKEIQVPVSPSLCELMTQRLFQHSREESEGWTRSWAQEGRWTWGHIVLLCRGTMEESYRTGSDEVFPTLTGLWNLTWGPRHRFHLTNNGECFVCLLTQIWVFSLGFNKLVTADWC